MIKQLATKYEKTAAQIILNWHVIHRNCIVIPKTAKVGRLSENFEVYGFKMTPEEYASIDGIDKEARLFDPAYIAPFGNTPYYY